MRNREGLRSASLVHSSYGIAVALHILALPDEPVMRDAFDGD